MSNEQQLLEVMEDLILSLMTTLGPILVRAFAANLISPAEQAELATIQASVAKLFMDAGGSQAELDAAVVAAQNRMRGE